MKRFIFCTVIFVTHITNAETIKPTVNITAPTKMTGQTGTVAMNVNATDNVKVSKVEFYRNGLLLGYDSAAPFSMTALTPENKEGTYRLRAKAYDSSGNTAESTEVVVGYSPEHDTMKPSVKFSNPKYYDLVPKTTTITIRAKDNTGIVSVDFYINDVKKFTDSQYPFTYVWDPALTPGKPHRIKVVGRDFFGNEKVNQIEVNHTTRPAVKQVEGIEMPTPIVRKSNGPRFTDIPEIVFVRGYSETEHMGIFHIDATNRWRSGDLTNLAAWKPKVATSLKILNGQLTGVSYSSATGILTYNSLNNKGMGSETAQAVLVGPNNVTSKPFNIRVLKPTMAWGENAASKFPGVGYNSSNITFKDMQSYLYSEATYENPNVLLITGGEYQENFYIGNKNTLYILGEPNNRPKLISGSLNVADFEVGYLKNLELERTTVSGGKWRQDRDVNFYATKIYQHGSPGQVNGFGTPNYEGAGLNGLVNKNRWDVWFWNFHGQEMGGNGNTTHQFYIEGRPNGHLHINNIKIMASNSCSQVKSTMFFVDIRNSKFSTVVDEKNLALGARSAELLDIVTASNIVIYNNELIGARSRPGEYGGTDHGLIFFRQRRGMWGSDTPAYPDLSWYWKLSSISGGGNYMPGSGYITQPDFGSGPETYMDPSFWKAVVSKPLTHEMNPYTFKKYVSFNKFRWIREPNSKGAGTIFRDDGTEPRQAYSQFSSSEVQGTIPQGWVERSVTFFANNTYDNVNGWTVEETKSPIWLFLNFRPDQSLLQIGGKALVNGPGPTLSTLPYSELRNKRHIKFIGSGLAPASAATVTTAMPLWFQY